ncbi:hypothetical protein QBC44DRAFT_104376 [Cladorrhinum sp. PSN332]|nr:hypothetical protein QBC44DRAFT_104376 [Cladorrhinum sp. PSN332]
MGSENPVRCHEHLRPPPRSLQRQPGVDGDNPLPQPWRKYAIVYLNDAMKAQTPKRPIWTRRLCVLLQIFGGVGFIITCVTLQPTFTSAADTKKATQLAQWTSNKEFLEFCETHGFNTTACLSAQNLTLTAPPGFVVSKWRRSLSRNTLQSTVGFYPTLAATGFLLGLACFMVIFGLVRRYVRWLEKRNLSPSVKRVGETILPYYHSAVTHYLPSFSVAQRGEDMTQNNSNEGDLDDAVTVTTTTTTTSPRFARKIHPHFRRRERSTRYKAADNHNQEVLDDSSSDELFTSDSNYRFGRRGRLRMRRRIKRSEASGG